MYVIMITHFILFFLVPKIKKQKKGIKDITHAVIRERIQIQLLSNEVPLYVFDSDNHRRLYLKSNLYLRSP